MSRIYTTLTVNFGSVRKTEYEGRSYYVAPMTMLVPGVHAGSMGPLLYTSAEIKNSVNAWEGMPITLNHPPSEKERVIIGIVKRPRITSRGALKAEAYIDIEKANEADSRIIQTLENNKKLEVSTGLYTRNEAYTGTHNGKEYIAVARNYVPDHLAVLPDAVGACSVDDGCGLNVNKKCSCSTKNKTEVGKEKKMKDLVQKVIKNSGGLYTDEDQEALENFSEDRLNGMLKTFAENEKKKKQAPPPKKEVKTENNDGDDTGEEGAGKKKVSNVQAEIKKYMKNLSPEDFYEIAPPEVKEVLSTAKRTHNERKAELISTLTSHCTTEEMRESLAENFAEKDIEELELLANAFTRPERSNDNPFSVNFVGNAGSPRFSSSEMAKKDREDFLPLPVMNWDEEAKAS